MASFNIVLVKPHKHIGWSYFTALVEQNSGQPTVRLRAVKLRLHCKRQSAQLFRIPRIYRLLLLHSERQNLRLSPTYSGGNIAHAVIVSYFLMLIPRIRLSCLCRQLQSVFRVVFVFTYQHTAAGGCYYLVSVKRQSAEPAECSAFSSVVG